MGINLQEIEQNVLNTAKNQAAFARNLYDLHYNPNPMDIEQPWIDPETGKETTLKQPNVAQFRKRVWDDVGGALGQLNRKFYVDGVNGNDNNTGTSKNSPFKTITKALQMGKITGAGRLLVGVLTKAEYTIDENIYFYQNYPQIFPEYDVETEGKYTIRFESYLNENYPDNTFTRSIVLENSGLRIASAILKDSGEINNKPYSRWLYDSTPIRAYGVGFIYLDKCVLSKNIADMIMITRYFASPQVVLYSCDFDDVNDDFKLIQNRSYANVALNIIGGSALDSSNRDKLVRNINRDADTGIPLNVKSGSIKI